jgi:chloramphenicol 3-O-phosphotransferase
LLDKNTNDIIKQIYEASNVISIATVNGQTVGLGRDKLGQIVILNGNPRAGKSSIATTIQNRFEGVWMNMGVDRFKQMTPERYQPGIGLRLGGERPDLEPLIVILYQAMYEAIAGHSRLGLDSGKSKKNLGSFIRFFYIAYKQTR